MQSTDHYAALGLDPHATAAQIRSAYRRLARQHHPDVNPGSPAAVTRTQAINAAYQILRDPERRRAYDRSRPDDATPPAPARAMTRAQRDLAQDVHLRIEEFFRGVSLEVRVNDPANPNGPETYPLIVPPDTAPGARFSLPRAEPFTGGFIKVRVRARPNARFQVRGADLRCDLRIPPQRAAQGGTETISGPTGARLPVAIPRGVVRGAIVRVPDQGLPKPRGGHGDLLVRILYRPEIRVSRT